MEAIKKIVSLEPFYSRQKSRIPFVGQEDGEEYPSLNWGKIAYGVDFGSMGEEGVRKYGMGVKKLGKVTFQELMKEYHKVKNNEVLPTDDDEILRTIVAFVDDKKVIDAPQPPEDPCCNPCAVPSPPDTYEMDDIGEPYFAPTVNFDICLTQSANLIGAYTFATKNWVAGKRYFAGDKVIYDGKTYELKQFENTNASLNGSEIGCDGNPCIKDVGFYKSSPATAFTEVVSSFTQYDEIYAGLSESLFDEYTVTSESEIIDNGYVYAKLVSSDSDSKLATYYIRPSWGGFNNPLDGKVYFDELLNVYNPESGFKMSGIYNTKHWKIAEKIYSNGVYGISSCEKGLEITADQNYARDLGYSDNAFSGNKWESKLVNFIRNTKSVDVNGNELPGRFNSLRYKVLDFPYVVGSIKNIDTVNTIPIGDYLASLQVIPDTTGLISIHNQEEHVDDNGRYTYVNTTVWGGSPADSFMGSSERHGNTFILYDEYGNEIFNSETDIEPGNLVCVSITGPDGSNVIAYNTDDNGKRIGGFTVTQIPEGKTSYNGDGSGFTIMPGETVNTYENVVENWEGETGRLIFTYYIGAELELDEENDEYVYNGGEVRIKYVDTYRFRVSTATSRMFDEDGNEFDKYYLYFVIDYDSKKSDVVYENIYYYRDKVILSDISVTSNTITDGGEPVSTDFQNADYFMEDYQLGIAFVANNNENVYVDRGSATAFERHMRLSEVDTLQDLENYGNGMFKMKE